MTTDKNVFDRYLLALRKTALDEKTEHTDRLALETLLQALADGSQKGIKVQHEPKRVTNKGAPDFKITKSGLILGYVENKAIGEPLDKVLKSEQIAKYKTPVAETSFVTDYLHFTWINKNGIQRESAVPRDRSRKPRNFACATIALRPSRSCCTASFRPRPEGIGRAQQLALALADPQQAAARLSRRGTGAPRAGTYRGRGSTACSKFSATRYSMS